MQGRKPSLALAAGEPDSIAAAVASQFEVESAPRRGSARLVGPCELQEAGPAAVARYRLQGGAAPLIAIAPPGAPPALVRDCYREGADDVVVWEEVATGELLRSALRAVGDGAGDTREGRRGDEARSIRALERSLAATQCAYDQTISALVAALDYREAGAGHHSHRVALYALLLGLRAGLESESLESLYRGALLHDVGKIAIPDRVLLKPARLDRDEWAQVRQHSEMGAAILCGIPFLREASDVPLAHHEAWNGQGYPAGLREHEIPLSARIFAVVDTYDTARSKRPYKEAKPHDEALEQVRRDAGVRLDPGLVEVFAREPESAWSSLDTFVGGSVTFESALAACREAAER